MSNQNAFEHPFDTTLSSGLRFLGELIAWVAGPWAAATESIWLAIPTLAVLVGLPSVFSTPGDKRQIIVVTPGPLRVLLELVLHVVALASAWAVWPAWLAAISTVVVIAAIVAGIPRTKRLLRGAPYLSG
jgi:hypothetical protein